jgi:hypothetical protein
MFRAFALCLCLCLVSGCSRISRTSECRQLAGKVNESLDAIDGELDASTGNPPLLRDIAGRYDRLAKDVDSFVRKDDNHGRALREYANLFRDASRQLGELASALDRHDVTAANKVRRDLAAITRRDKALVARIEAACIE